MTQSLRRPAPLLLLGLLLAGCGGSKDVRTYETGLFHLGAGFNAKSACSCLFVMDRDEDFCREWTRVSPDVARFKVDAAQQVVTSKVLGGWKRSARYVDDQVGCVVE